MKLALFTKLFGTATHTEVADVAVDLGFAAVDLLVREGGTVSPDAAGGLPGIVNELRARGLDVPLVTTDITDTGRRSMAVLEGCAKAEIPLVRLGYWNYEPDRTYRASLDAARADIAALSEKASRLGLVLAVQLHGGTIHASGALTKALLEDTDATTIGAYVDPGNQAVQDGREDWRLTFELLGDRLTAVGVKNGGWWPGDMSPSGQRLWTSGWLGVADGLVPWDAVLSHLTTSGFDQVLSFHSHYKMPYPQVLDQTRLDLRYVRRLVDAC